MFFFSVNAKPLSFDEVYNQSSPTNCTVYCGGINTGTGICSQLLTYKVFPNFKKPNCLKVFSMFFLKYQ